MHTLVLGSHSDGIQKLPLCGHNKRACQGEESPHTHCSYHAQRMFYIHVCILVFIGHLKYQLVHPALCHRIHLKNESHDIKDQQSANKLLFMSDCIAPYVVANDETAI